MSQTTIRILIIDDHAMVRRGMRLMLEAQPDLEVVAEAGSMLDSLDLIRKLKPDLVTLDLSMPGPDGVASISRIRQASPNSRIIVVSMHDDPAYVRSAFALGASGYVSKGAADGQLVNAARTVAKGKVFIDAGLDQYLEAFDVEPPRPNDSYSPASKLTERELEVLSAVAQGYSNQQVADRLFLSVKTVESYRGRLMQKLGLRDRADLVRLAIGLGLLQGPSE